MTAEDLSSTFADSNTERMIHELRGRANQHRPPKLPLPLSARESTLEEEEGEERPAALSARVADEMIDERRTVENIVKAIEAVGDHLYFYTTPEQRKMIRRATCPPGRVSLEGAVTSNPMTSISSSTLLSIAIGIFVGSMLLSSDRKGHDRRDPYCGSNRAVDRLLSYA